MAAGHSCIACPTPPSAQPQPMAAGHSFSALSAAAAGLSHMLLPAPSQPVATHGCCPWPRTAAAHGHILWPRTAAALGRAPASKAVAQSQLEHAPNVARLRRAAPPHGRSPWPCPVATHVPRPPTPATTNTTLSATYSREVQQATNRTQGAGMRQQLYRVAR
jgi:hypothetical protein